MTNLLKILKEKRILYGLQREILLPIINKTLGRNDLKVKVTSLNLHPRPASKDYKTSYPQARDPIDDIKSAFAKAVFNGERFLLNAKNVLKDLFLNDAETLKNGKLTFLQWLRNEKEIAGAHLGNIIRNERLPGLGESLRRVKAAMAGLVTNTELHSLRGKIRKALSDIRLPTTSYLTRKPVAVANVYPVDNSSPLSVREQIVLQYMIVILGGAMILAT